MAEDDLLTNFVAVEQPALSRSKQRTKFRQLQRHKGLVCNCVVTSWSPPPPLPSLMRVA